MEVASLFSILSSEGTGTCRVIMSNRGDSQGWQKSVNIMNIDWACSQY